MSREISFRAWTGRTMMYQDQQYLGSFIRRVVMRIMLDNDMSEPREHESYLPQGKRIDDYLMQYTGYKDNDDKKIYDGDIVRITWAWDTHNGRVFWGISKPINSWDSGETWMLHFYGLPDKPHEREGPLFPYCDGNRGGHEVHVIGNIYENPNLLEASNQ